VGSVFHRKFSFITGLLVSLYAPITSLQHARDKAAIDGWTGGRAGRRGGQGPGSGQMGGSRWTGSPQACRQLAQAHVT